MKRARDDEDRDFDEIERDRQEAKRDDGLARAEQFRNYPEGWLDGDEW